MARRRFDVSLVTPEGAAFEGEAEMLIVPGAAGEIGVLARHAPLVATLKAGSTRVHVAEGEVREYATGPGVFKVELDRAIALESGSGSAGAGLERGHSPGRGVPVPAKPAPAAVLPTSGLVQRPRRRLG